MFVFYGIPLVIVLLGGWLFILGVRPRRRGETPYCRKCGYNLTGRTLGDAGERCSECGAGLVAANIVRGERRRRPWRAGLGVFVALLGATPLVLQATGTLAAIDWYKFKPTFWVKADAEGANLGLAKRAFTELDRRYVADALSGDDRRWFIEFCLKEHALRPGRTGIQTGAVNVLWREYEAGTLSEVYTEQLFAAMITAEFRIRPQVKSGNLFDVEARGDFVVPDAVGYPVLGWDGFQVEGQDIHPIESVPSPQLTPTFSTGSWSLRATFRGSDKLTGSTEILATLQAYVGTGSSHPIRLAIPRLSAPVEVIADESASAFPGDCDANTDDELRKCVTLIDVRASHFVPTLLRGQLRIADGLPMAVAFDVILVCDGFELQAGRLARAVGNSVLRDYKFEARWEGAIPEYLDVRLHASQIAADASPDVCEYWPGELVFEGVRVNQATPLLRQLPRVLSR